MITCDSEHNRKVWDTNLTVMGRSERTIVELIDESIVLIYLKKEVMHIFIFQMAHTHRHAYLSTLENAWRICTGMLMATLSR